MIGRAVSTSTSSHCTGPRRVLANGDEDLWVILSVHRNQGMVTHSPAPVPSALFVSNTTDIHTYIHTYIHTTQQHLPSLSIHFKCPPSYCHIQSRYRNHIPHHHTISSTPQRDTPTGWHQRPSAPLKPTAPPHTHHFQSGRSARST